MGYIEERNKLADMLKNLLNNSKGIAVSSYVLTDGIGDLGQLNNLYEYLLNSGKSDQYSQMQWCVVSDLPIISYKENFEVLRKSKTMDRVESNMPLGVLRKIISEMVRYEEGYSWLEYPATLKSGFKEYINHCQILEMGVDRKNGSFKTGELDCGIGYGIPNNIKIDDGCADENIIKLMNGLCKEKVWLCSFKTYNYGDNKVTEYSSSAQTMKKYNELKKQILDKAIICNVNKVIWVGSSAVTETEYSKNDKKVQLQELPFINQMTMDYIIQNMNSESMVICGGEGLYTRAMGNYAVTGGMCAVPVLAARYKFQYKEIAYSILKNTLEDEPNNVTCYEDINLAFAEKGNGTFIACKSNIVFDENMKADDFEVYRWNAHDNIINILSGQNCSIDMLNSKKLYFCPNLDNFTKLISLNAMKSEWAFVKNEAEYKMFLDTFKKLTKRFINKNWFNLIS